jgi:hypothetical protein
VRRVPQIGDRVAVVYLSVVAAGEVIDVDEDERRIVVVTADAEQLVFELNRATGKFHANGGCRINPSAWDSHRAWDVWSVYQPKYPTLRFGVDAAAGPGVHRPVNGSEKRAACSPSPEPI